MMNLHWAKTLEHKWVKIKSRPYVNYTLPITYNVTELRINSQRFYQFWSEAYSRNQNLTNLNHTGPIHAENQFLKKSRILSDMIDTPVKSHSFTTVIVIASLFLFLTMTITVALVVFCRKRNSVFALQKSEQEDDIDYEMEEMNTDIEYTETEFESETDSLKPRRSQCSMHIDSDFEQSPLHRPLVENNDEREDSPVHRVCQCGADPRGAYQRMVVTAVLEKPLRRTRSDPEDSGSELRTCYLDKLNRKYYGFAAVPSDVDSDHEGFAFAIKKPMINITYVDDPPSYDSIQHSHVHKVQVQIERHQPPDDSDTECKAPMVVTLPGNEKKSPLEGPVVYVDLPPKSGEGRWEREMGECRGRDRDKDRCFLGEQASPCSPILPPPPAWSPRDPCPPLRPLRDPGPPLRSLQDPSPPQHEPCPSPEPPHHCPSPAQEIYPKSPTEASSSPGKICHV